MKTLVLFAGTRPEIIKMAPLVRELKTRQNKTSQFKIHFCFSGQHLDLALPFLQYFNVEPDSHLDIMAPGQSLGQLTSKASIQVDRFLDDIKDPAATLVQGDTTTAFVAALTSYYHKIPVAHVEAGLRTESIYEPFPEEMNRRMISQLSTWHYAPTLMAKETLVGEGFQPQSIEVTGNTGIDSLLWTLQQKTETQNKDLVSLKGKRMVLVTVHRRENHGVRFTAIMNAIKSLASEMADVHFVFPVHPNPLIAMEAQKHLSNISNIRLLNPLNYIDLVWVIKNAELIMTDSGGIQEEAPSVLKPVLVLREDTERPEAVAYGTSIMTGTDELKLVTIAKEFLTGKRKLPILKGPNPYGDGQSAPRIASHLLKELNLN